MSVAVEVADLSAGQKRGVRIPALDGLRGIAILQVLMWHAVFAQFSPSPIVARVLQLGKLAWSGVDLFFVLSGFLIGGILLDAHDSEHYFQTFYLRRAFRILPLYLVVVSLYLALSFVGINGAIGFDRLQLPAWSFYVFLQNFWMAGLGLFGAGALGPTWSLAVEEQFYLSVPWLIRKLTVRTLVWVLLSVVLAAPVVRTVLIFRAHGAVAAYVLMPCRADALSLGVLCAVLARSESAWAWMKERFSIVGIATGILLLVLCWFTFESPDASSRPMATIGYSVLALVYSCALLGALTERPKLCAKLLLLKPLRHLGNSHTALI